MIARNGDREKTGSTTMIMSSFEIINHPADVNDNIMILVIINIKHQNMVNQDD